MERKEGSIMDIETVFRGFPAAVLLLLGTVFITVGRYLKLQGEKEKAECTVSTAGEVTGEEYSDGAYSPVMRFTDGSGNVVEGSSGCYRSGWRVPHFAAGTKLEVKYDPLDPRRFVVPAFDRNVFLLVGDVFTAVGYILGAALIIVILSYRGFFG